MPTVHIETAVQQLLRNISGIVSLVGTRIHPGVRPQGDDLPSIVVRKMEGGDDPDLSHNETHRMPRVAVEIYSTTYYEAADLAELARGIETHTGIVTAKNVDLTDYGTLTVHTIQLEDEAVDESAPQDGSDTWTHIRTLLFFILCDRP
jgi:hypothetical protein